jgi:hypothetical protein
MGRGNNPERACGVNGREREQLGENMCTEWQGEGTTLKHRLLIQCSYGISSQHGYAKQ